MTSPHRLWPEYEQPIRGLPSIQVRLREKSSKPCSKSWKPTLLNGGLYDEYGGFSNSLSISRWRTKSSSKCLTRRIARPRYKAKSSASSNPHFAPWILVVPQERKYRPSHWFHDHISQDRFVASPSTRIESLDYLQPFYQSFHHLLYLKTKNVKTPAWNKSYALHDDKSSIFNRGAWIKNEMFTQAKIPVHNEKSLVFLGRENPTHLRNPRCYACDRNDAHVNLQSIHWESLLNQALTTRISSWAILAW